MRIALLLLAAATLTLQVVTLKVGQSPLIPEMGKRGTVPLSRLTGIAVLPADTFAPGPPSGAYLIGGLRADFAPFEDQPVQGVSSIWPDADGWFWALTDNGFGTKLNSPDYLLRIYRLRPRFDDRRVEVDDVFIQLSDPDRRVPFRIVNEDTAGRLLTGADFDPESMVRMPDGTFWIGDEFGPFLLHISADGRLLSPPVEAPGVRSPDHPLLPPPNAGDQTSATVGRSRGFEGLAPYGREGKLVALLEGGLVSDEGQVTRALEFDPEKGAFTGREWVIPFEQKGHAFTELVRVAPERVSGAGHAWERLEDHATQFLIIERDGGHGPDARFKKVFQIGLTDSDPGEDGSYQVFKGAPFGRGPAVELLDLLNIPDPAGIGGPGGVFRFPYITTEALWPLWPDLIIVNDNNFPATGGRHADERDPTEFIRVRLMPPEAGR
jgi:hypothetical protein